VHLTRTSRRAAAFAVGSVASLLLIAGPAGASAETFTGHSSEPVAGDVFTCSGNDLTVTGGTLAEVFHENEDAQRMFHYTGTVVPHDVTLVDGAGNTYTISGASWFGGTSTDDMGNDPIVFTGTDHFVIHDASGAAYATVRLIGHLSPNGHTVEFDRGDCVLPEDG
jgi:hypothetical protein